MQYILIFYERKTNIKKQEISLSDRVLFRNVTYGSGDRGAETDKPLFLIITDSMDHYNRNHNDSNVPWLINDEVSYYRNIYEKNGIGAVLKELE